MATIQLAALALLLTVGSASANYVGYYIYGDCSVKPTGSPKCTGHYPSVTLTGVKSCVGITVECFFDSHCTVSDTGDQGSGSAGYGACASCDDSGTGDVVLKCTPKSGTIAGTTTCTTASPVGSCGDPHFSGPGDIHFDWHGRAGEDFSLISDTNLEVNAHFIGERTDTENVEHGTWIQEISVGYKDPISKETHFLSVGIDQEKEFEAADVFYFTFDGQDIPLDSGTALYSWTSPDEMATLTRLPHKRADARIEIKGLFEAVLLPRVESRIQLEPLGKYLDMDIRSMSLSRHSHGVLGQMFRPDAVERKNAGMFNETSGHEFLVDGKVDDYHVSSLSSYDSVFNQFNQEPTVSVALVNYVDTARKMLGAPSLVEETAGTFSLLCSQQGGSLSCN